ncbi:MAG: hypothetical protein HW389_3612, partial [Bacteroidetes bacterium]|nr:hypothetical protein [Bacteroidota bacterium]
LVHQAARGQLKDVQQGVAFAERNLGGPRLGVTYVMGGGNGELVRKLRDKGIGTTISQFGWHFEYQIIPEGGGPQFVIQAVPFVGGVEYGTVIPSLTLAMGIRLPEGIEFGLGPNVIVGGLGKSFNYGGVSIPINLGFATSPAGNRISVVFGYAIAGATK